MLELAEAIAEQRGGHGPLLSVQEAAMRLGVAAWRVYELKRLHTLPVVRMGRSVKVDSCVIDAFIRLAGSEVSA